MFVRWVQRLWLVPNAQSLGWKEVLPPTTSKAYPLWTDSCRFAPHLLTPQASVDLPSSPLPSNTSTSRMEPNCMSHSVRVCCEHSVVSQGEAWRWLFLPLHGNTILSVVGFLMGWASCPFLLWLPDVSGHRDLSALEGCLSAASCGNDLGARVGKVTDKEQNPVARSSSWAVFAPNSGERPSGSLRVFLTQQISQGEWH